MTCPRLITLMVVVLLTLPLPLGLVGASQGAPAITCHCFQDRQFDPAHPAAADPYLLATVQNRLIAALSGLPRQEIVRRKMAGTPGDRLWVALYVADVTARPVVDVLAACEAADGWPAVLVPLGADPERLGSVFMAHLTAGDDDAALADAVIEQLLPTRLGTPPAIISELRSAGAGSREVVAAVVLAEATGHRPAEVYRQAMTAGSWGQWLDRAGLTLAQLDAWLAKTLQTRS